MGYNLENSMPSDTKDKYYTIPLTQGTRKSQIHGERK